jgi:hypothetical protein
MRSLGTGAGLPAFTARVRCGDPVRATSGLGDDHGDDVCPRAGHPRSVPGGDRGAVTNALASVTSGS